MVFEELSIPDFHEKIGNGRNAKNGPQGNQFDPDIQYRIDSQDRQELTSDSNPPQLD
jgi:hypothetical protein